MRILNGVLAVFLLLFVAVQYNDPDGMIWMVIYGVGAVWCAAAAFRPKVFASGAAFALFGATLLAALWELYHYWPTTDHFWMMDVWWETETAREGMGVMILVLCLLAAGVVALRSRRGA